MKREHCRKFPNLAYPEKTLGSNRHCIKCEKRFSVWDDENIAYDDNEILCAKCKGIEMVVID